MWWGIFMSMHTILGIGSIRFPQISESIIDLREVRKIILEGEKQDIFFIDTSYAYFGGQCEVAIGLALKERREKWKISTRFNPVGKKKGDLHKYIYEQLDRLNTNYIDYYGFHGISKVIYDDIIIPRGFLEELVLVKKEGLVKKIGFSFHDEPENLEYIINAAPVFDYVICQYNFIKCENRDAISYAKHKGLETIVMGPFCGGKVKVDKDFLNKCQCDSSVEMALRYVLSNDNIDIILSGVQNVNELIENAAIVKVHKYINIDLINKLVALGMAEQKYYCTGCGYCLPCSNKINIPEIFNFANNLKSNIDKLIINKCSECGLCEKKCPQKLKIRDVIAEMIDKKQIFIRGD